MATHDYVIDNASGSAVRTDLNNVLQAVLTNNSSSSAPSTTAAYMLWADTSNNILKMRNSADNAWINLFTLSGGVDVDAASNFASTVVFTDDVTFDGATAGRDIQFDRSDNALEFLDNAKATFGSGADLEIYHDGTENRVASASGVNHRITTDQLIVNNAANNEEMFKAIGNGACELYFDAAKKAETVTGGFTVTGTCTATAFAGDGSALTGVGGGVTSDSQGNTIAGTDAGASFSGTSPENNTLFGKNAGTAVTTGDSNVAVGTNAFANATTQSLNVAVGLESGRYITSQENTCVGAAAGRYLGTGGKNVAIGRSAMHSTLSSGTGQGTGEKNVAVGFGTLFSLTSGSSNVIIGDEAGKDLTSASFSVGIGHEALSSITTTGANVAVGHNAGKSLTSGYGCIYIGEGCGDLATTGYYNTAVGRDALGSMTTAVQNHAFGTNALLNVTTGNHNVAMGTSAGQSITTGNGNVCIGNAAGVNRTTGSDLTAIGNSTSFKNETAGQNTAVGGAALYMNVSGNNNTAMGTNALYSCTGGNNTAVGRYANMLLTTANANQSFGYNAGYHTTTGDGNINLGGQPSTATASYQITLGTTSHSNLRCNDTSISSLSDERDKTDIVDLPVGLDFLNTLKPRQFKWQTREGNVKDNRIDAGFVAQELQTAQSSYKYLRLVQDENPDKLEAKQGNLIPLLVKAIQELSVKVTALEAG